MATVDKIIVTHRGRLVAKYGSGMARIDAAVKELVAADAERGINTRLIALDDTAAMARCRGKAVADPGDEPGVKAAIDRIALTWRPDYLMILGSRDVVPHQTMRNTKRDGDPAIPSDLPYACDTPYTRDPRMLLAPTRVVGRLPDITAERKSSVSDPAYLAALLRRAARWRCRQRDDYERHFGLSALSWEASTNLSLKNVFGDGATLHTTPPQGPAWPPALLNRRVHFINCHGGAANTSFFGEDPETEEQSPALEAARLQRSKAVAEGAVVAAECCYGADLYDPAETHRQLGICFVYLGAGCYGFFGSTCTAYGPSEGNGQADLICQYFVDRVLRGASLGRAAIEAQLKFVQACGSLQPEDVKTLAQFLLLGDPSVQPIARAAHGMQDSKTFKKALDNEQHRRRERVARRTWILRNSVMVAGTVGVASLPGPFTGSARIKEILTTAAREAGVRAPDLTSHGMRDPIGEKLWRQAGGTGQGTVVHVATGFPSRKRDAEGIARPVSIVATVRDGNIVYLRRLFAR